MSARAAETSHQQPPQKMPTTRTKNDSPELRNLNDYESMLATMTCNVGIRVSIPSSESDIENSLRQAWSRTVIERSMMQVKIVPIQGNMGPLGQRYTLDHIDKNAEDDLFVIHPVNEASSIPALVRELQRIGTTALDISKGSHHVECSICQSEGKISIQVILSLCHSLSDGPGALRVAKSFLQHFGTILDTGRDATSTTDDTDTQTLTDLQALILGNDYGSRQVPTSVFDGQDELTAALAKKPMVLNEHATLLPPEAMQSLPTDDGFGGPTFIDCVYFTLSAKETTALRDACRRHGTTVQGALTAASIKTRAKLLGLQLPVDAAVQVPVNTRFLGKVDADECLCGSAGAWHMAQLCENEKDLFALARRSSESIQDAIKNHQPQEWLRRLFHAPATLPPYSLMVSSIGVVPIEETYGCVQVEQLYFFGGALRTESPSQAQSTMLHAVTFRDELTCMLNFTSPGVSKQFVKDTARLLKANLLSMAAIK